WRVRRLPNRRRLHLHADRSDPTPLLVTPADAGAQRLWPSISLTSLSGERATAFRSASRPESLVACMATHPSGTGAHAGLSAPSLQGQQEIKEKATPLGACRASGNRSCVASTPASMPSPCPASP